MTRKQLSCIVLTAFLLIDLGYSFIQHYNMPLDGDMPFCIVPAEEVELILGNPFGWEVIRGNISYANPNRFVSHWTLYQYFNHVPLWLQRFTAPLDSVYLAAAIFKTSVQLLLLLLLAMAISGQRDILKFRTLLAAVLVTPFFQANGYFHYMGIIDQSITYTFFYAFPLALLLLYFMPLFLQEYYGAKHDTFKYASFLSLPLALACSLSGPTMPGVAIVLSFLLLTHSLVSYLNHRKDERRGLKAWFTAIPGNYWYYLVPISAFSLYSLYLGSFNTQNPEIGMSLLERYAILPEGLYQQFFQKLGFPVLLLILLINTLLIAFRYQTKEGKKILNTFKWIGLFALLYLLLLPLGGYREYRPYILRYDTIMPITLSLLYIFGKTSIFLLGELPKQWQFGYVPLVALVLFIFTNSDEADLGKNTCEQEAIAQIAASSEAVLKIDAPCTIIAWETITDPQASQWQIRLLRLWRIMENDRLFYQ